MERFIESMKLSMFLSVKADDIKFKSFRDSKGDPVDCNIYHPKYGYCGCVDSHMEAPVTMFTSMNYKDYKSNQWVHCVHDLQVLCVHTDGTLTNKDEVEVFEAESLFPGSRIAENETDFSDIYDRESKKRDIEDNLHAHRIFRDQLIKYVEKLIELYTNNRDFENSMEIDLLAKAKMFIDYVKSMDGDQSAYAKEQIPQEYIKFWMQFTQVDSKTQKPYLDESDVKIFLMQAFGGRKVVKTFDPDMSQAELAHAAYIFRKHYVKNEVDLSMMTRIMIDNFPNKFSSNPSQFVNVRKNIKWRSGNNIFKIID